MLLIGLVTDQHSKGVLQLSCLIRFWRRSRLFYNHVIRSRTTASRVMEVLDCRCYSSKRTSTLFALPVLWRPSLGVLDDVGVPLCLLQASRFCKESLLTRRAKGETPRVIDRFG